MTSFLVQNRFLRAIPEMAGVVPLQETRCIRWSVSLQRRFTNVVFSCPAGPWGISSGVCLAWCCLRTSQYFLWSV